MDQIKWVPNEMPKSEDQELEIMSLSNVEKALNFHRSFPQYSETPLRELQNVSQYLGIGDLFVKDESYRFGLNAFKVLGGSFAMANYIAEKTGKDISELDYATLTSNKLRDEFGQATFFTATDGNHGRGVAWAANKLGQKSVVLMPKGSTKTRFDNIQKEGASVTIEEMNYDDCVRKANGMAEQTQNGVMVQDTAWEGYEKIPSWIMQGYGTMALEASRQLKEMGCERPTHIFVQAGVGSLAGAVQGFFANLFPDHCPITTVVEAQAADCLYRSAEARSAKPIAVGGDLQTIMAGLACGEANTISFEILKDKTSFFASCPDWVSELGMRMLAAPLKGDSQVISGESGAVGMGLVAALMTRPECAAFKNALGLDESSKVLLFSTEGDTDPEKFKEIVWGI